MPPTIHLLTKAHDRTGFACGHAALDRYLQTQARQDMQRHLAQVFVLVAEDGTTIQGYYTLSAGSVQLAELPEELRRTLPRYPKLPVTLLGRLAVDARFQGQKLGAFL